MAKFTYRDYTAPSYRYSRERKIWKRSDGRYLLTGLPSKEEAEQIRECLVKIVGNYGFATIVDLYDAANVNGSDYTDNKIGWNEYACLDWRMVICWDERNGWFIELPKTNWDSSQNVEVVHDPQESSEKSEYHSVHITIDTDALENGRASLGEIFDFVYAIKDRDVFISVI